MIFFLHLYFVRDLDPSLHLQSGTHLAPWSKVLHPVPTTRCSLQDPTAVCHHPGLTDLHVPAPTTCRLVHLLQTDLLLFTGLHFQLMDTQVCLCLDQWGESLDLDPPTDTHSTPGLVLAMPLIPGVHHHHISVPLRLIILDRCLHHTVSDFCFIFSTSSVKICLIC